MNIYIYYYTSINIYVFSITFVWNIIHSKKKLSEILSKMYIGLHVKYPLVLSDFNITWIIPTYFRKSSNMKFHENPSSRRRIAPWRWDRQTDRQDMTILTIAFRNFANAPKNVTEVPVIFWHLHSALPGMGTAHIGKLLSHYNIPLSFLY